MKNNKVMRAGFKFEGVCDWRENFIWLNFYKRERMFEHAWMLNDFGKIIGDDEF